MKKKNTNTNTNTNTNAAERAAAERAAAERAAAERAAAEKRWNYMVTENANAAAAAEMARINSAAAVGKLSLEDQHKNAEIALKKARSAADIFAARCAVARVERLHANRVRKQYCFRLWDRLCKFISEKAIGAEPVYTAIFPLTNTAELNGWKKVKSCIPVAAFAGKTVDYLNCADAEVFHLLKMARKANPICNIVVIDNFKFKITLKENGGVSSEDMEIIGAVMRAAEIAEIDHKKKQK